MRMSSKPSPLTSPAASIEPPKPAFVAFDSRTICGLTEIPPGEPR